MGKLRAALIRKHIQVQGIVQGVGFRPFVYNLAKSHGLTGCVFNSSQGVTIEIQGCEEGIVDFLATLQSSPPHLAQIDDVALSEAEIRAETGFLILHSQDNANEFSLVPTDSGTCDACRQEISDPWNRRFGYPFTNCTQCGPRYTIIHSIPYDRSTTTMSKFTMCAACDAEYRNPTDRRFHAQPNACATCGPSLALVARGSSITDCSFDEPDSLLLIREARSLLRKGKIVAVKGLGGFLLACDATNEFAVAELRRRKHRPDKPFAIMVGDIASAKRLCDVSPKDEISLASQSRPIVILPRSADSNLAESIAPGNDTLGIMLPYTPLHYLLFSDAVDTHSEFAALVMTSGNLSEEPIVVSNEEALEQLGDAVDWFLLHNRDIHMRVDDSVVRTFEGRERVLRRSRGFAPQAIDLKIPMQQVLAFGAQLKNTFCLTRDRYAILSQHIGDLENYETMQFFEETLTNMKELFRIEPQIAAYDLHPQYMSTRMALASTIERKIGVQHHHAHIASCMAENHLQGKVIGVAFDGTGYGTDGRIWGGEFLVADFAGFSRRAHLRNVLLPGGDAAIRQPWRMAASYLYDTFGQLQPGAMSCFREVPPKQFDVVSSMIARSLHTVETSSSGRLFDAIASLLGLGAKATFEGQAAIALETLATSGSVDQGFYPFDITDAETAVLDLRRMIEAIVDDLDTGTARADIARRFHHTLSTAIIEVCCRIRKQEALDRVCLSGGTFQNHYLLAHTVSGLRSQGFAVFLHATVPANDGGISLGQAVVANALLDIAAP
jgi:hydrogenase maturation protein HypF